MNNQKAYSIKQFCEAHSFSRAKFYLLMHEGKAPRLMMVGRRRLISLESAAAWRKMMEAEAQPLFSQVQHDK
jgi:predicted DNA-binding transcriptional regulator AlpA